MDTAILTISPQGQITIPKEWRQGIKQGQKILAIRSSDPQGNIQKIELKNSTLTESVTGIGKGLWGDSEKYLKDLRDEWERKDE